MLVRPFVSLALVATLAGCPSAGAPVRPDEAVLSASPQARAEFERAFEAFRAERWAEAAQVFAAFLEQYPDSSLAAEARFRQGVALARADRPTEARAALRVFLERHPTSPYAKQGTVELGLVEARLGNVDDARQILDPVENLLTPEQRAEVAPVLEGTLTPALRELEIAARAVEQARGAERPVALGRFAERLDLEATPADVNALLGRLSESHPAWGLVAVKAARLHYHLGDRERARDLAQRALAAGAGPYEEGAQAVLERLGVSARVRPGLVGVILPLSGDFRRFGEAVRDGIALAIGPRDGLELVYEDSKADPQLAVQAVEKLARAGAQVILGPVGVAEAGPAAARAQELGVPIVLLSRAEHVTGLGPYVFRNSLTNTAQGQALARYSAEVLGQRAAAVLAPNIPSAEELTVAFWRTFEDEGGEMRGLETFPHDQTNFSRHVRALIAKEESDDPELRARIAREKNAYRRRKLQEQLQKQARTVVDFGVLVVPDYYRTIVQLAPALAAEDVITTGCDERELERIKKTTRRDDVKTVTLLGTAEWNNPLLLQRGGRYVECAVFVDGFYADSAREPTRRFVDAFRDQYQRRPGLLEAQGYDTAAIVKQIVARARPSSRPQMRDELSQVKAFPGATGDTTFGPDGEADKPLFFLRIKGGKLEELDVAVSPAGVAAPRTSGLSQH